MTNIPGKHIRELQKTAIFGTAHILWKVLMVTGHMMRWNYLLKHIIEEKEDEEEDVSSYWISTKREDNEILNKGNIKPWRTPFG
jgi:hypothetical protein